MVATVVRKSGRKRRRRRKEEKLQREEGDIIPVRLKQTAPTSISKNQAPPNPNRRRPLLPKHPIGMTHERHLSILYSIQIKRPDIIVRGGVQETLQQTGAKKHQRSAIGQLLQSRQKEHPMTSRRVTERPSPGKKKHPERPPKGDQQAETKLRILEKPSTHLQILPKYHRKSSNRIESILF
jgi:hypothetical protein